MLVALIAFTIPMMLYEKNSYDSNKSYHSIPFTIDEIDKLSDHNLHTVVVYPVLTQYAYQPDGFYDYCFLVLYNLSIY